MTYQSIVVVVKIKNWKYFDNFPTWAYAGCGTPWCGPLMITWTPVSFKSTGSFAKKIQHMYYKINHVKKLWSYNYNIIWYNLNYATSFHGQRQDFLQKYYLESAVSLIASQLQRQNVSVTISRHAVNLCRNLPWIPVFWAADWLIAGWFKWTCF